MKIIEQYITFWINNWSKKAKIYHEQEKSKTGLLNLPLMFIFVITSKDFIEAIAKWLSDDNEIRSLEVDRITTKQAIAIRDNKLEEFIINLNLWEKVKNN